MQNFADGASGEGPAGRRACRTEAEGCTVEKGMKKRVDADDWFEKQRREEIADPRSRDCAKKAFYGSLDADSAQRGDSLSCLGENQILGPMPAAIGDKKKDVPNDFA